MGHRWTPTRSHQWLVGVVGRVRWTSVPPGDVVLVVIVAVVAWDETVVPPVVAHCGTKKREREKRRIERDAWRMCGENGNYASSLVLLIHTIHRLNINGVEDIKRLHSESPPPRILAPSHSPQLTTVRSDDSEPPPHIRLRVYMHSYPFMAF